MHVTIQLLDMLSRTIKCRITLFLKQQLHMKYDNVIVKVLHTDLSVNFSTLIFF